MVFVYLTFLKVTTDGLVVQRLNDALQNMNLIYVCFNDKAQLKLISWTVKQLYPKFFKKLFLYFSILPESGGQSC